jgi:hypothetical protein
MRLLHSSLYHTHQFVIEGPPGPSRPGASPRRNRFAEARVLLGMRAKLCRLKTQPCSTSNETTRSRRNSEGRSYDRQTGPAGHPVRVARGMGDVARRTPWYLGWAVGEVRKKRTQASRVFPMRRPSTSPSVTVGSTARRPSSTRTTGCSDSRRAGREANGRRSTATKSSNSSIRVR